MKKIPSSVALLYGTTPGRWVLSQVMKYHLDKVAVWFLRSPLSKPMVRRYVRQYRIPLTAEEVGGFRTFQEFFVRFREPEETDSNPEHLISPCDGKLSVFPVDENSLFHIKNSHYQIKDFIQDEALARTFDGGTCMIFRLSPNDYHHYCYIDDGYQEENHFIPGILHSVQPIACETYPVYVLNRRSWCLLETDHFGPVIWTEIGALVVGGICNPHENIRVTKGMEKGHFDLAGSTIVLLFQKDQVALLPELAEALKHTDEVPVTLGMHIGNKCK